MERTQIKHKLAKYFPVFLVVFYTVGVAGHLLPQLQPTMLVLTPISLALVALLGLYLSNFGPRQLVWVAVLASIAWLIEAIGTNTGLIFGAYSYGNVLGIGLFATPFLIGINWVTVTLGGWYWANQITTKYRAIFLAGILAVVFDYIMEPVAIQLGYWQWDEIQPPLQNYLAWFVLAVLLATILYKFSRIQPTKVWGYLFLAQLSFFFLLMLFLPR